MNKTDVPRFGVLHSLSIRTGHGIKLAVLYSHSFHHMHFEQKATKGSKEFGAAIVTHRLFLMGTIQLNCRSLLPYVQFVAFLTGGRGWGPYRPRPTSSDSPASSLALYRCPARPS